MYAIVRTGGHQHKVAVGDTLEVDRMSAGPGDSVSLPAVLVVDDDGAVTSDAAALAKARVTAEVVEHGKGPKIVIHKFRNKTGYHKRQGHRQRLTTLRVTGIDAAGSGAAKSTTPATTEAPAAATTEAPAVTTTEAPAVTTTEAPAVTTSEAPAATAADTGEQG